MRETLGINKTSQYHVLYKNDIKKRCRDTQPNDPWHNDIHYNDTHYYGFVRDIKHKRHSA
jgi:hypothetical protein